MEHVDVVIVGAGQAGLAVSHELSAAGVEHVVLERGRVGETWRHRWDTFCLVTPNWTMRLPSSPYSGPDPHGFMPHDEIVAALEEYAGAFAAPVREGITVAEVESSPDGGFIIMHTTAGDLSSRALVLATGAFPRPHRPAAADTLPTSLPQIDVDVYRNEGALPPGRVLVVGSGQSGAQISEELREAGREVVLACGKAAWVPRRLGGHDILPSIDEPGTFATHAPEWLDLSDFGVVIFAGGFRPDYRSWLPWPDAFDELGFPYQQDGVSTVVPGLFFVGVHFMRTRKPSLFLGVGEDATIVSRHIDALLTNRRPKG